MIKQHEMIRNFLEISRQSTFFTSFQMFQLSAMVQEIHVDFVTFSKYSKSVYCKCNYIIYNEACCGIKQYEKLQPCAASGPAQTLNHLFARSSCQYAKVGFVLMMYLPVVLSGKSLVLAWLSCVLLPRGLMAPVIDGRIWSLSPVRSLVCTQSKMKSANSSISLFMFPVLILLRADRRSSLQCATKCLITLQFCVPFRALVV